MDSDSDAENIEILLDNSVLAKSFASSVPQEKKNGKKRRGKKHEEEEPDWEKRPRSIAAGDNEDERDFKGLPVRTAGGKWVIERRDAVVTPPQSDISEDESDNLEDQLGNQSTAEKNASNTEPRHSIKSLSFHDKRQSIGDIACKILANPEDSLDQFKRLRAFHKDASPKIVIIAILTELAIFRDILPGYRIRQLTDKEKTVKVSKEVQKLRNYEESLVINYQHYLYFLEQIIGNQRKSSSAEMLTAAFKCFSQLLESCSHFNFCDKLMNAVVRGMTTHDGEIQALCYQAVCGLFKEDLHGERSLECIRLIGKQLKTPPSGSALLAKAVDCLLSVRIEASVMKQTSDATNKIGGKKARQLKKPHISKRKKKELKAQMEIENELKEAEAVYSQEERKKLQTESLKQIFAIYIRVIKSENASAELLGGSLRGMAHFAHYMGMEYFQDLLATLSQILDQRYDQIEWRIVWQICVAAFTILSGPGEVLLIDAKQFYRASYRSLTELSATKKFNKKTTGLSERQAADLIASCMDLMFCKRGQKVSPNRTVAFLRQLTAAAMQFTDANAIITLLLCIKRIWMRSPLKVRQMLQLDDEIPVNSMGLMCDMDDPDFASQALISTPWNLPDFLRHSHSEVKTWVRQNMKDILAEIKTE